MLLILVPNGCPIVLFIDETLERRRDAKIIRKAKMTPSMENITSEITEWAAAVVKKILQAA